MATPAHHAEALHDVASALADTGEKAAAEITATAAALLDYAGSMLRDTVEPPSRDALDLLLAAKEAITGSTVEPPGEDLSEALRAISRAAA